MLRHDARRPLPRAGPGDPRAHRRRDRRRLRALHRRGDRRDGDGSGSTRSSGPAVLVASHGPFAWGAERRGGGRERDRARGRGRERVPDRAARARTPSQIAARAAGAALPAQARPGRVLRPAVGANTRYAIGIDFGTESGRAVLVDCADGRELGTTVYPVPPTASSTSGCPRPHEDVALEPDWALQDPEDYVRTLQEAVPALLAETGVDPAEVIGIGIDFTACTMLPTLADGTPLCVLDELRRRAARLGEALEAPRRAAGGGPHQRGRGASAASRGCRATAARSRRSGSSRRRSRSSTRRRTIYARADRLIEAADWIVWQLTGVETRNTCTAGYKAIWSKRGRLPGRRLLRGARPAVRARRRREDVADDLADREPRRRAERAGRGLDGPAPGHGGRGRQRRRPRVRAGGDGDASPGRWSLIMGTSICHILLGDEPALVEGMCGVVEDGIVPGPVRLRGGPVGGRRHLRLVRRRAACRPSTTRPRRGRVPTSTRSSRREAARLRPGESGLLALDWWNGNRSILVDADLSGLLVGAHARDEGARDLPRADRGDGLRHAGDRRGVRGRGRGGRPDRRLRRAAGAEPAADADLRRRHRPRVLASPPRSRRRRSGRRCSARSRRARELGGYDSIAEASRADGPARRRALRARPANRAVYDELYAEYRRLHDLFGRGGDDVMKRLKTIQQESRIGAIG